MNVIRATAEDVNTIKELAHKIWLAHYPAIIGEEQTQYMLAKMYNEVALKQQIQEAALEFYVWFDDETPVAFAAIDSSSFTHGFLSKFYLVDEYRGTGLAQNILAFLESAFHKKEKKEIQLTVNRQNIGAINFYFKTGFKILRCADFDIGNGYFMNDFVMGKRI